VVVLSARDISPAERSELAGVDRVVRKGDASLQELAAEVARLGQIPEMAPVEPHGVSQQTGYRSAES
jgi:hypothetical protein